MANYMTEALSPALHTNGTKEAPREEVQGGATVETASSRCEAQR